MFDLPPSRRSCTKKVAIGFWAVVLFLSILCYDFAQVSRFRRILTLTTDDEQHHDLPPIYWINLDRSTERKDSMTELFSALGISDTHRVSASNVEATSQMLEEGRLIFHPQVKIGETKNNRQNIYDYKEAACLLSHLDAIKQAYDDGHELALILEDDAKITHKFQREWRDYVAWRAPRGWKVLQMATINTMVMEQGVNLGDRFISWQPWHYSTRAYFINRAGMETLMGKSHSVTATGETVWRIDESPMVVADEVIYANIGESYTSTSLWVDSLELPSTVDGDTFAKSTMKDSYAPYIDSEKEKEERFDESIEKSLLVLTRATFSEEKEIVETIMLVGQDNHAVCRFHQVCEWEIDVALTDPALVAAFDEISSKAASNIHFHVTTTAPSEQSSDISHILNHADRMEDFDLVLLKNVKQRINGFPWRSFVETREDAIISGPLRQRLVDAMLSQGKDKWQTSFHEALPWNRSAQWSNSRDLFANVIPTEVPVLERYFVLFDAKFARYFFNLIAMPKFANSLSKEDPELLWCQAAKMWDDSRPGCYLIPVVSKDESNKEEQHENNARSSTSIFSSALVNDQTFAEAIKCSLEWKHLINSLDTIKDTCNQLAGNDRGRFDLQTCAMHFYSDQCRPSIESIQ